MNPSLFLLDIALIAARILCFQICDDRELHRYGAWLLPDPTQPPPLPFQVSLHERHYRTGGEFPHRPPFPTVLAQAVGRLPPQPLGVVVEHVLVPVLPRHQVVRRRAALSEEVAMAHPLRRAGRKQGVPPLPSESGPDHHHGRALEVEGPGGVCEDRRVRLLAPVHAVDGVDADERRELEAGLRVAEGKGECDLAAAAVAADGEFGGVRSDVLGKNVSESRDQPVYRGRRSADLVGGVRSRHRV